MNGSDEALRRALRYPYAIPEGSYVLVDGQPLDPALATPRHAERTPLLAYGANAAPEALARKLGPATVPLVAHRATLAGFDVVYSAHLSSYGAVPATLSPSPGTEVGVFVLDLTREQRRALDRTEPNYELSRPPHFECRLDDGERLDDVPAYLSRHGCLELDGTRVALAAIPAKGRRLPAMGEPEVLDRVRLDLAPEHSLERFVIDTAADPALAGRRTGLLRRS